MSLKSPGQTGAASDVSELRMATMYGIEGLKRCTDTDEYDRWLSLFGEVLRELEKPWNDGRGNFPFKEFVIPDDRKRKKLIENFENLDEFANELEGMSPDEREMMEDEIEESIAVAEEIYEQLESAEGTEKHELRLA